MLELESAVERILAALPPPVAESVPLEEAHHRFLAENIVARLPLPAFDNSSMDGYAVRAADVATASADQPAALRLIGKVAAGEPIAGQLQPGEAMRIFTGSLLPGGADAIVIQEDTRIEPGRPGEVLVLDPVKPWENVRFRGEDVKTGAVLGKSGDQLVAGRIALLAATGVPVVRVGRRPTVVVLATGSELKTAGEELAPGQIYESNRAGLAPLIRDAGAVPQLRPIVPDDSNATRAALDRAFAEAEVVITCGGVSVGEMDFVKAAFEAIGGTLQFWKVAIKPGRPFVFGRFRDKFLFGLPGNPVSSLVTFLLLVRPALLRWQGARDIALPSQRGVLAESLANPGGRRHFVRVTIDSEGMVHSAGIQGSHMLSSVAAANGLLDAAPQTTLAAGTTVKVLRWQ